MPLPSLLLLLLCAPAGPLASARADEVTACGTAKLVRADDCANLWIDLAIDDCEPKAPVLGPATVQCVEDLATFSRRSENYLYSVDVVQRKRHWEIAGRVLKVYSPTSSHAAASAAPSSPSSETLRKP